MGQKYGVTSVQDGVQHRFVGVGGGVTIHVADAGAAAEAMR